MSNDLARIIALAQSHASTGKTPKYIPALDLAYARTIDWLVRNWGPKEKTIPLKPSDAEVRIRED